MGIVFRHSLSLIAQKTASNKTTIITIHYGHQFKKPTFFEIT